MEYNFSVNKSNLDISEIRNRFYDLETKENEILELHENNEILKLFDNIKNRNILLKNIKEEYNNLIINLSKFKEDLKVNFPLIQSVELKEYIFEINNYLIKLESISNLQLEKLNISENLLNFEIRNSILKEIKNNENNSKFIDLLKEILLLFETNKNDFNNNELNSNITNNNSIKEKEEVSQSNNNFEENKELEEVVNINKNNMIENIGRTNINYEDKNNSIEFNSLNIEPNSDELKEIILKYFIYNDSSDLSDEEKEKIKLKVLNSDKSMKLARVIWNLTQSNKINEFEDIAKKIYSNVLTDLHNFNIGIQPYSLSLSWSYWELAKNIYYSENPNEADRKNYNLLNPLTNIEKQVEIQDRQIGWEVYNKMIQGKLDDFLNNIKNPIFRKRLIEFMIEKPKENGTLPSYKLAELGKNVRLGFNLDNN